jgi:hypothetical protein
MLPVIAIHILVIIQAKNLNSLAGPCCSPRQKLTDMAV